MIPTPIRKPLHWWQGLSGADKYRLYTRLVLQSVLVCLVVALVLSGTRTWSVIGVVAAGVAAMAGIEAHPDLSVRLSDSQRLLARRFAVGALCLIWVLACILTLTLSGSGRADAALTAVFAYMLACASVIPFVRHYWIILPVLALLTAAVAATLTPQRQPLTLVALLIGLGLFFLWTTRTTVWGLQILTELERSKHVAAQLTVAEERLRFSRDLHDVVGRAFSAVAVKSELAATLARAGALDRAAAEMDEVKALAVTSMDDARSLVRGYRGIDLGTEVAGARSLLSAAGCTLRVIGGPDQVPTECHEAAAWVVREGTTNIVKHSSAQQAVLTLSDHALTLRNDGVGKPENVAAIGTDRADGAGLDGLRARLIAVDADLTVDRTESEFAVTVTWGPAFGSAERTARERAREAQ